MSKKFNKLKHPRMHTLSKRENINREKLGLVIGFDICFFDQQVKRNDMMQSNIVKS